MSTRILIVLSEWGFASRSTPDSYLTARTDEK
jgi:hypothetical protein